MVHINVPYLYIFRLIKGGVVFCMYVRVFILLLLKVPLPPWFHPLWKSHMSTGTSYDALSHSQLTRTMDVC